MLVPWWKTIVGEDEGEAAKQAIIGGAISQGEIVKELEHKLSNLLGIPYITMTTSGSMALAMSLISSGVKPGDEVIVPNFTFLSTNSFTADNI